MLVANEYANLASPAELDHLIAMGFCNMGEGCIARLEQRVDKRRLNSLLHMHGSDVAVYESTPPALVEHLYRREFSGLIRVGGLFAEMFPASEKTVTRYISPAFEDRALLDRFRDRLADHGTIETAKVAKERREQQERNVNYLAGALF